MIDLLKKLTAKIDELGEEAASKLFKVGVAKLKKWKDGTAIPDITHAQIIFDELVMNGEISIPDGSQPVKNPPAPVNVPAPAGADAITELLQRLQRLEAAANGGALTPPPATPPAGANVTTAEEIDAARKEIAQPESVPKSNVMILMPTNQPVYAASMMSVLGIWKSTLPEELRELLCKLEIVQDTLIHHGRNLLADRFMKSGLEWSFWHDRDIIAPIGNPAWFRGKVRRELGPEYTGKTALRALIARGKSFTSATYVARDGSNRIVAQCGMNGGEVVQAPQDKLLEQNWVGMGCAVIHRKVFEAIMANPNMQDIAPKKEGDLWGFFNPNGDLQSEDVAFCKRATESGHRPHLDLGLVCGHIGQQAFLPVAP